MWSQSQKQPLSCGHRPTSAPWAVFGRMSHRKKNIYISLVLIMSVPLTWMPVWPCSEKHRTGEGQADTSIAMRQSHLTSCQIFRSEKPGAGGEQRSHLPVLWGAVSPLCLALSHPSSHVFHLPLQAWNYPRLTLNRVISCLHAHVLPVCERLFQPVCQQTPVFFLSDLAQAASVLQDPVPQVLTPALCNHLPMNMLPSVEAQALETKNMPSACKHSCSCRSLAQGQPSNTTSQRQTLRLTPYSQHTLDPSNSTILTGVGQHLLGPVLGCGQHSPRFTVRLLVMGNTSIKKSEHWKMSMLLRFIHWLRLS